LLDHIITGMTSPAFERLPTYSLRGRIAETLREAILNGSLEEGQRLVERNLAAQLGASLTAVREALIELEMEGFIQKRRNAATYVTKLTLEDAEKIFAVRSALEPYAMEQAALLAGPEHIQRLEALHLEMEEAARANDSKAFLRKDYSWHEAIWQITGNEYLQAALRRLMLPLFAFTAIRIVTRGAFDLLHDAQTHLPILDALTARNPEAARNALLTGLTEWNANTRAHVFRQNETQPEISSTEPRGAGASQAPSAGGLG
jgi:DNA-binding GntR family transcriptional regulator